MTPESGPATSLHDAGGLELATMVNALRQQLQLARSQAPPGEITFTVSSIELEASVQVSRNRDARGGVKFYVVEAGGGVAYGDTSTQRIKLTMAPVGDQTISDEGEPIGDEGEPR